MKTWFGLLAVAAMLGATPAVEAATLKYSAVLSGAAESPPNASPGTGTSLVVYDDTARTLSVSFSFSGLSGTTTAAHIHGPTAAAGTGNAGVITPVPFFPGFPTGVTSGSYSATFDLTKAVSYNPSFVASSGGTPAAAEAALAVALADGKAYLNIHTTLFAAGEIRGFYTPVAAAVPVPAALPLMLAGLGVLGLIRRRRA